MKKAEPLFELRGPDGHMWRLFENGRAKGFPLGTVILNRARPLLAMLQARIANLERAGVTSKKAAPNLEKEANAVINRANMAANKLMRGWRWPRG